MLSWKRFVPEIVFVLRATAWHAWTQRRNFCRVWLTSYGNSSPRSVHVSWISFTTLSMYCPFSAYIFFVNNNFCHYFSFPTIISTRPTTKLSFHWHFLPFLFFFAFPFLNSLENLSSSYSLPSPSLSTSSLL